MREVSQEESWKSLKYLFSKKCFGSLIYFVHHTWKGLWNSGSRIFQILALTTSSENIFNFKPTAITSSPLWLGMGTKLSALVSRMFDFPPIFIPLVSFMPSTGPVASQKRKGWDELEISLFFCSVGCLSSLSFFFFWKTGFISEATRSSEYLLIDTVRWRALVAEIVFSSLSLKTCPGLVCDQLISKWKFTHRLKFMPRFSFLLQIRMPKIPLLSFPAA